uniref:DESI1 isopeptidase n=1 Tax=Laticauda laticaudata TaxID=8630 RepID=A0A8C5SKV5_LATLA
MDSPPMLHSVKLYVYDLSKGMARRLSPIMLGKSGKSACSSYAGPRERTSQSVSLQTPGLLGPERETMRRCGVVFPFPRPIQAMRGSLTCPASALRRLCSKGRLSDA